MKRNIMMRVSVAAIISTVYLTSYLLMTIIIVTQDLLFNGDLNYWCL